MKQKSRYLARSRVSDKQIRGLVRYFALDLEAVKIARLSGLNRKTVDRYLRLLRERMAEECEAAAPFTGEGDVEMDESYFGPRRVRGRRGRGAYGKTIVFGVLKRGGKVYTEIVPDVSRKTLTEIISGRVDPAHAVHSDGFRSYDGLVDLGYRKHYRIYHDRDEFVRGKSHINGIEGFWGFAKSRLARYRGVHRSTFYLHLKECEWRFNHRGEELYPLMLRLLRKRP
ncbi:MAG: IS1595 family transposase [Hymenobacter sp.]